MKNLKFNPNGIFFLALVLLLCACEKSEIKSFEAESAVTFLPTRTGDKTYETTYSFLGNTSNEYVQNIEVQIIGDATDHDRFFNAEVVKDSITTAPEDQYEIMEGIVKAGEFTGNLSVKLYNSEALDSTSVSINLKLTDSEDFRSGIVETNDFKVSWTNKIVVPSWFYYRFFFTAKASTSAYRAIVISTGVREFNRADFFAVGVDGATALGTQFGDYVKQWNLDNPDNPLKHDDGDLAGQDIVPRYYTKSKYD